MKVATSIAAAGTILLSQGAYVAASGGGLRKAPEADNDNRNLAWGGYWQSPIADLGLTCIDNSIRAGGGKPLSTCITEGEAICIDYGYGTSYFGGQWTFGIKDGKVRLWNPRNEEVWEYCAAATQVCIGETHGYEKGKYSEERPYLFIYNEKTHETVGELICDGTDGKDGKNIGQSSILKMIDNADIGKYADYPVDIVKFKKGQSEDPDDNNALWSILFDPTNPQFVHWDSSVPLPGYVEYNEDKCTWTDTCPLPPFDPQPTFSSSNGRLDVALHIGVTDFESTEAVGGGFESNVIGYRGCYGSERCGPSSKLLMGGPTFRVKPGDEIRVRMYNDLPEEKCKTYDAIEWWNRFHAAMKTNLHWHGFFVPNEENDVLATIDPGDYLDYYTKVKEIQQGGTHWYHPHSEGSVGIQAGGGAIGFAIVEDDEGDLPPEVASLPEVNMRIQYTDFTYLSGCPSAPNEWTPQGTCWTDEVLRPADLPDRSFTYFIFNYAENYVNDNCRNICKADAGVSDDYPGTLDCGCDAETECSEPIFGVPPKSGIYSQALTVNGAENPTFELAAGQWYRFRTVFAPTYKKSIEPALEGCDFKLLAKDGRYIPVAPRDIESGYMFSGSRADFLVRCMEPGEYSFESIAEVPLATDWATYNSETGKNDVDLPDGNIWVASQKWEAWTGTMATLKVVDRLRKEDLSVDVIPQFFAGRPCYLPDMRDVEHDDEYVFLQSGMAPPNDWAATDDGEMYPFFRRVSPPWPGSPEEPPIPFNISGFGPALLEYYGINNITETETAWPGLLSPPKGNQTFCDALEANTTTENSCNKFKEYYGRPNIYDFTFEVGDIVKVDYFAPQIHPLHLHVFGYQVTKLPEFDVKKDYFKVGDYHDTLIVPIDGTDPEGSLTPPMYGKVEFKQHIYDLETEVVVHCHFYRHSDNGMVQLGLTEDTDGIYSSPKVTNCYSGAAGRQFTYCSDDPTYCNSFD